MAWACEAVTANRTLLSLQLTLESMIPLSRENPVKVHPPEVAVYSPSEGGAPFPTPAMGGALNLHWA